MAFAATRQRPMTSAPSDGSRTITLRDSQPREDGSAPDAGSGSDTIVSGTLRLRGAPRNRPRVVWREDVVDNEGAGKKSSKICCIYHKPRKFDESSSEESSDSDSDSDSHSECDHAHGPNHSHRRRRAHPSHRNSNGDGTRTNDGQGSGVVHELEEDSDDVNVYERVPGRKAKKGKAVSHS
ncbi:hypothetical protein CERSUDRAFT_119686 [Gelatoporia subvermispora B]|uniref:Type 1 phosphatases regulator n=1 Tax=Ceriporiopsis subvermispora (strain B) TaxID=914234 RepID=M2QY76_CERS8|nr:hypothetical protein CERSUDRAFT_119686 [Gelatoporia subvermispora B]